MTRSPFPTHALPGAVRAFVEAEAEALGCDASMVALPALAALAGAVGASRAIEAKRGWAELPIVWACVVAPSGTLKSPAMRAALAPLHDQQSALAQAYELDAAEHALAVERHARALAEWKKRGGDDDPPREPHAPEPSRILIGDTTLEALAPILRANPRGVLLARDEIGGWVRGFDAYKGGRGGDAATWLGCWQGDPLLVDRKTGERRTLHVPRACVSVCGTTQPGTFARVLTGEHMASGLTARLLLAAPEPRAARWTDESTPQPVRGAYERTLRALLSLSPTMDASGETEPLVLPLTPEARAAFAGWFDTGAERMDGAGDELNAALSKLRGYALRLALLHHLAHEAEHGGGAEAVGVESLRAGCVLADWFAAEAERVYGLLGASDAERELRDAAQWIIRQGGAVTVRELQRGGPAVCRPPGAARRICDRLEATGAGFWALPDPMDPNAADPQRFRLLDRVLAGEWPPFPEADLSQVSHCRTSHTLERAS